ncbi:hypothetical protein CVIRNUC_005960 [Coccomyxa viridis]|uniref:Uncharacterized protein n=1 Tax=Coccomyxa viridis TaxID=1274662 RepID=A0AAV1I9Q5_9CHLO|nr:hypothetical protein CVIRNUC_005960 [Coccomyxa viridis]
MATQAALAKMEQDLAAERAAHYATRFQMAGKQALLERRLEDIADLKAHLKRSQRRGEWLEAELRAIQRVVLRALDRSISSPEDSIESTVPLRPGGAVRADNGTTRSDAHAAAVQAANEEVDHVTSSMGSVSISPPPSYSGVVVWAPSEDNGPGQISEENKILEDL